MMNPSTDPRCISEDFYREYRAAADDRLGESSLEADYQLAVVQLLAGIHVSLRRIASALSEKRGKHE